MPLSLCDHIPNTQKQALMRTTLYCSTLILLMLPLTICSQNVLFNYDENGNRVSREIEALPMEAFAEDNMKFAFINNMENESPARAQQSDLAVSIGPNPTSGKFTVNIPIDKDINHSIFAADEGPDLWIQTTTSKRLIVKNDITSNFQVDISDLDDGMYFLTIFFEGKMQTLKIIKHSQ